MTKDQEIADFLSGAVPELEALGWWVEVVNVAGDLAEGIIPSVSLLLFRVRASGTRHSNYSLSLRCQPLVGDLIPGVLPGDPRRKNIRRQMDPWRLRVAGGRTIGAWADGVPALAKLVELAEFGPGRVPVGLPMMTSVR